MDRFNSADILQFSSKSIKLQIVEDNPQQNGSSAFKQQSVSNKIGIGSLNLINSQVQNPIIYKIRGNRPKNYRLVNPCHIIEVGSQIKIDFKLVSINLFTPKDLFEVRYIEFTPQLKQIYQLEQCQSIYDFWHYIDQNTFQFNIKKNHFTIEIQDNQGMDHMLTTAQKIDSLTGNINKQNNQQQINFSPLNQRSTSPKLSASQSPMTAKSAQLTSLSSKRSSQVNGIGSKFSDQNLFYSQVNKQKYTSSINGFANENMNSIQGSGSPTQDDYKQLYEKLVMKVDEQDKQLFVLNQERKKLEQDWKLLNKKQEQLNNSENQVNKSKSINGIQPISAIIIAIISLLIGIYLGN
ncbi:transmembrane protein, putative (macronuclear) [Tetrahymena thermophila SB210]|uniref:Transmembrane protein, putative n=1 Tax=Tetrahymena thermophila (strain SB210) TaxID=312017 RepID=Q22DV7_TETTS|nr:transmembrane protein, putative [Tetrahymena thermophila SB210]EAR83448.1 transmembrane protein, putative [Tetrahymena thermophila SB210]|eukprot:XP_001031111.1 transmembrane protein, putative [Tetrahymena thermophila SB210]